MLKSMYAKNISVENSLEHHKYKYFFTMPENIKIKITEHTFSVEEHIIKLPIIKVNASIHAFKLDGENSR